MCKLLSVLLALSLTVLLIGLLPVHGEEQIYDDVIRLHVIANSDTDADQELKLLVRDALLVRTEELLSSCRDRADAESVIRESLALLRGLVDIYLPDFKYYSPELAAKYSHAADYRERAEEALLYMHDMLGEAVEDENGMMKKGIIVRHLVLPGHRKDSIDCIRRLAEVLPVGDVRLSLMRQYTPDFYTGDDKNLHRRLTSFEYESVLREAEKLGFDGYMQSAESASAKYTPEFTDGFSVDLS